MDKIKLVIWDLDETFWKGTLSEDKVYFIEENIKLVRELTDRGIINSIVSKNDFEAAKSKLIEANIFDLFIFPFICWDPKGPAINTLIEKCQLRAENVLFLDDNHLNLEEAKFYNEGIHIKGPDFIPEILTHQAFKGKDDKEHSRLNQYKLLVKRDSEVKYFSSNEEFLKSSNIRIEYLDIQPAHIERLHELLERTNQLNFTKKRLSLEEINQFIVKVGYENKLIRVIDNYGDYGIVGFYSFSKQENKLEHFTFSCRILNIGVDQFLYAKLGFPALKIVPEVAVELNTYSNPDWIYEQNASQEPDPTPKKDMNVKVFFKGGCDLEQMLFYLDVYNIKLFKELNYVSPNNLDFHREHTQILVDSQVRNKEDLASLTSFLPFMDENTYSTKIFDCDYDILVYSVLMDYTQELYENKITGIKVPFGGYYTCLTDLEHKSEVINNYKIQNIDCINETFIDDFNTKFVFRDQISGDEFYKNLSYIRNKIPANIPIIFINGSEVESPAKEEILSTKRHIYMNAVLDKFITNSLNCFLVDIRKIVTDKTMVTNNIRHYQRFCYSQISEELLARIEKIFRSKIKINKGKNLISKLKKIGPGIRSTMAKSKFLKKSYHFFRK